MEYVTLNNGVNMPMAGIGTFLLTPDEAEASCISALQDGYRLIDTANAYVNEKAIGRAIGLFNFNKAQIEEILSICDVRPTVLQTELHPYHQEPELKAFLKENGIVPQAWYPLGHGDKALLQEPLFAQLGKKYGKSAPQIILRWHIQSGNIVIPGSKIRSTSSPTSISLTLP